MRISIIPAQITTVEDKITSSLNLTQIIILVMALVLSFLIYLVVPPFLKFSLLKIIPIIILCSSISSLAIRIDQDIVLNYLILYFAFFVRPKIYVLLPSIKNDSYQESNENKEPLRQNQPKVIFSPNQAYQFNNLAKDYIEHY